MIVSQIVEKRQLSKEKITTKNASENIIDLSPQMEKMEREINELKKIIQGLVMANTNFSKETKGNRVQNKKKLLKSGQVRKEELDMICQKKAELTKLENEIEQQLETKIEINKK